MKLFRFWLFCAICCLWLKIAHAEESPLRLLFPVFKPYTYLENGYPVGIGIRAVNAIMVSLNQPVTLKSSPNYGRAVKEVRAGRADGFFLASRNNERDAIADFSAPVVTNNWSWFLNADSDWTVASAEFIQKAKVGTFLHANTHKWLIKRNFQNIDARNNITHLPELLSEKRLDAVFLAEAVFWDEVDESKIPREKFRHFVAIAKPFGIYISKDWVQDHPGFMTRLNKAIGEYREAIENQKKKL